MSTSSLRGSESSGATEQCDPCAGNVAAQITKSELETLLTTRVRCIFEVAVANRNEVLILGVFGCGAFRNLPEVVAKVFVPTASTRCFELCMATDGGRTSSRRRDKKQRGQVTWLLFE